MYADSYEYEKEKVNLENQIDIFYQIILHAMMFDLW